MINEDEFFRDFDRRMKNVFGGPSGKLTKPEIDSLTKTLQEKMECVNSVEELIPFIVIWIEENILVT